MAVHAHVAVSEEVEAAERAVLGLTAAVGGMAAGIAAVDGDPFALVAVPTLLLVVLLAGKRTSAAGYVAAALWLAFLLKAPGLALLVPPAMALACVAIAVGPERFGGWLGAEVRGRTEPEDAGSSGWIEEVR